MRRYLHWVLLGALLLTLAFDVIVWASAAALPQTGVHLGRSARREAPLTYFYMQAGRPLIAIGPIGDYGRAYANRVFSPLQREIALKPELAMELAHGAARGPRHSTLKLVHPAPPLLLLAWVAAYLMRPKTVHLGLRPR
ncbi:MAG TPA: hypothetical protein VFO79_14500 [Xanthomonadales bacterium]|nr:hypothetical protein [Xanthomonadales bacterium]